MPSLLAAGLVGVLALASAAGSPLLAAAVAVVQGVFTLGAVRRADAPGATVAAWLGLAVGIAASAWLVADDIPNLTSMARLIAAGFLAAVVTQLWRRHGRPRLTTSISVTVAAIVLAALPASLVALRSSDSGVHAVGLGLLGVGVVCVVDGVGGRSVLARTMAVLAAGVIAVGLVMLVTLSGVPEVGGVVLAVFGGLMAVAALFATDRLAQETVSADATVAAGPPGGDVLENVAIDPRSERSAESGRTSERAPSVDLSAPLRATMPIIVASPVIYLLGRLLIG